MRQRITAAKRAMLAPALGGIWTVCGMSLALAAGPLLAGETVADAEHSARLFSRLDKNADGLVTSDELPPEQRRLFARLLRTGDSNADGRLDENELQAAMKPSVSEKPILRPLGGEMPDAQHARLLLVRLDADRDRMLTRDEVPAELRGAFDKIAARADQNNDGIVNRFELNQTGPQLIQVARRVTKQQGWDVDVELKQIAQQQGNAIYRFDEPIGPLEALADPQRAKELFYQLDTNGDGRLTLAEVPAQFQGRLKRLFARADRNRDSALTREEYFGASRRIKRFLQRNRLAEEGDSDAKSPSQKGLAKQRHREK